MNKRGVVLSLVVMVLAGCSSTSASSPEPTDSAAEAMSAEPSAGLGSFESTCSDDVGDGRAAADIASVELTSDGSLLFVTFQLAEPAQAADFEQIGFYTTVFSADGEKGFQIGSKFIAGSEATNFVFDLGESTQENITNGVLFADGQISMRYPLEGLEELGSEFTWYSVVAEGSDDVDSCGGPMEEAITVVSD